MTPDLTALSGLALALGLRHGLDPDHIAAIDGMTLRAIARREPGARWIGTLFASGHGAVVTLVAVAVCLLSGRVTLPAQFLSLAEWVPIALLLLLGLLNWRALRREDAYEPLGWKLPLLPRALRAATHPAAVLLVGIVFALAFDTATQAIAWGCAATADGGAPLAVVVGLLFTLGMAVTDTLDSHFLCRLVRRAAGRPDIARYRRTIGWLVVALSLSMAAYGILTRVLPTVRLYAGTSTIVGGALVLALLGGTIALSRLGRRPRRAA